MCGQRPSVSPAEWVGKGARPTLMTFFVCGIVSEVRRRGWTVDVFRVAAREPRDRRPAVDRP
jgi:hypothetical protein